VAGYTPAMRIFNSKITNCYPTEEQIEKLLFMEEQIRFLWNSAVEHRRINSTRSKVYPDLRSQLQELPLVEPEVFDTPTLPRKTVYNTLLKLDRLIYKKERPYIKKDNNRPEIITFDLDIALLRSDHLYIEGLGDIYFKEKIDTKNIMNFVTIVRTFDHWSMRFAYKEEVEKQFSADNAIGVFFDGKTIRASNGNADKCFESIQNSIDELTNDLKRKIVGSKRYQDILGKISKLQKEYQNCISAFIRELLSEFDVIVINKSPSWKNYKDHVENIATKVGGFLVEEDGLSENELIEHYNCRRNAGIVCLADSESTKQKLLFVSPRAERPKKSYDFRDVSEVANPQP
jgi:hypothetical protein